MGVVPLLILVNKMNALSASLPASSTNALEVYMLSVMGLLCLHLCEFAVVNCALRRERELKALINEDPDYVPSNAPECLKRILYAVDHFVARHVRWNLNVH